VAEHNEPMAIVPEVTSGVRIMNLTPECWPALSEMIQRALEAIEHD